jgi:hypothetical protein
MRVCRTEFRPTESTCHGLPKFIAFVCLPNRVVSNLSHDSMQSDEAYARRHAVANTRGSFTKQPLRL